MGKVLVEESQVTNLKKKIKELESIVKKSPGELITAWRQGVQNGVTMAIPAGDQLLNYIDGMDITLDHDSDSVVIDWSILGRVSSGAGTHLWRVVVDGHVDWNDYIRSSPTLTTNMVFHGQSVQRYAHGRHRYRLAFSCSAAITLTLVETARYFRVLGISNKRRRYLDGR